MRDKHESYLYAALIVWLLNIVTFGLQLYAEHDNSAESEESRIKYAWEVLVICCPINPIAIIMPALWIPFVGNAIQRFWTGKPV